MNATTRQETPRIVEPTAEAILDAANDLAGDLRRLGLGMQADKARTIALAATALRDREYQAAHDKAVRQDMQTGDYWGGLRGNRTGD